MLVALLSAALVMSGSTVASAEAWSFQIPSNADFNKSTFFQIDELYDIGQGSHVARTDKVDGRNIVMQYCSSIGLDPNCPESAAISSSSTSTVELRAQIVMGVCQTPTDSFCIENLRIYKSGNTAKAAQFIREVNHSPFSPNDTLKMPAGGAASIWDAPEVTHAGGASTYSAYVKVTMLNFGQGFKYQGFTAVVSPYNEISGDQRFRDASKIIESQRFDRSTFNVINRIPAKCSWMEEGKCGLTEDFADGTRVGLTFRVSQQIGGFFNGRLKAPDVRVEKFDSNTNRISVDGEPVSIPRLAIEVPNSSPEAEKVGYKSGSSSYKTQASYNPREIETFRNLANDTATAQTTSWQLSSISQGMYGCFDKPNQLVGLVTTNAMGYESGAPQMSSGFLNYKVLGMHYLPDGKTEAQGSYDLLLRSDVARCLYGFSKAPISATISVTGGTNKTVATTVVSEKNGWLKMAAYGFTFSDKTIKVKITQPKVVKKTTITCVKGKVTKKVTAAGPKCPTGFKKK